MRSRVSGAAPVPVADQALAIDCTYADTEESPASPSLLSQDRGPALPPGPIPGPLPTATL